MPSSRGSSQSRDQTHISYISCIGRQVLYHQHHLGSPSPQIVFFTLNDNSLLHPLVTSSLLSVSMNLPSLGNSPMWNHTIFLSLCPVYFTQCNVSKIHPCGSIFQTFIFLWLNNTPFCVQSTLCVPIHPSMDTWLTSTSWLL